MVTCFCVGFYWAFSNHFLPRVFITTDIYIKIRYLFMLVRLFWPLAFSCSFFMSYQLPFHASNSNDKNLYRKGTVHAHASDPVWMIRMT